ncbi:MAG TPA: primosomal protein N' [Burkholderiales bacterium]|nr:primosomal protein N' [Burkholderiales bacterium]
MAIAKVALDCPVDALFDYRDGGHTLMVGQLVVVPFGKRRQVGLIMEIAEQSAIAMGRLRTIERVLPVEALPSDLLELIRFASDYYQCAIGQAGFTALPAAFRRIQYARPKPDWEYVITEAGRLLHADHFPARAIVKRRLQHRLREGFALGRAELLAISARAVPLAEEWVRSGWVAKQLRSKAQSAAVAEARTAPEPTPSDEQRVAVESVSAELDKFLPWLLHGVTGSGKTEVYFRLIRKIAERGQQTLLMVPEINLTPQLEARFRERFPGLRLVSLHSNLAEGERSANWIAARAGEADVVIGTRLAIFTPLPRLGLIIVDEEQDASFKQQDGLRYSARDLAVFHAKQRRVPIVLGSATPALETYHNARSGRFRLLRLSRRPVARHAAIRMVDTSGRRQPGLSDEAAQAICARLSRGEQSLVFLNRRGFAPALVCNSCGWNAGCTRCSARLVWHFRDAALRCHYCGHEEKIPGVCPTCGNQDIKGLGQGTQRLEQALAQRFPQARILRIDRDSTRRKHAWPAMQDDIRGERVDILVGTQMLAKGHDFPKLTLVVVVDSDNALFSADFRAREKLFQQLMQVAGRAGRADLPGEVLVQSGFPQHPLYAALLRQDYSGFANELIEERRHAGFPPFVYQAILRAESQDESKMTGFLDHAAGLARTAGTAITPYDPVPATIAKIAGHHRGHLLVQSASRSDLQKFLGEWRAGLTAIKANRVRWSIDVDPMDL